MDSDDGGPFSLTPSLTEGGSYGAGNSTSVASQYHVWAAAAATSTSLSSNNTTTTLPTHFSPVSPTGHGLYNDHLTLPHPTQSAVDALSMRLSQGDYHSTATDRLSQGDAYHATVGAENGGRHPGNQSDYHDHLVTQERHLGLESYHHISSSSSSSSSTQQQDRLASADYHTGQTAERLAQNDYHSAQQSSRLSRGDYHSGQSADRLVQNDYHATQQSDRLGQGDYHSAQQSDRLGQQEYHVASQSDRLGQLDYSGATAGERLQGSLTKQDYHALGGDQLGQHAGSYHSGQGTQQASAFHSGQAADRSLAAQADYHSAQVDLDAVSMHTDFDRRHLDVSLLPKDLVDSGQRGSAMDYLTSQTSSRDTLVGLHPDIVGLQREIDLSVGQTISLPQRSAPGDLASTSYALDPATLPRDLSPYNQRDLDRAMLSASDVVAGQVVDGGGAHSSATGGVGLHPQDLAGINLTAASRDLVDLTTLARSGAGREDLGRVRDAIHRPRNEIQRALELEVLGSLDSSTASVDLTLNGGSSTKSSSRTYPSASRLATSAKRQTVAASQAADVRLQNPLSAVTVNTSVGAGINFFQLQTSRDPLNIMAMADSSVAGGSSRHNATDFARQQPTEMSRLRRELTTPYTDLGVHHSMLATAAPLPVPAFKSAVDQVFSAHGDLICNDTLTSSRERLYEMMKQQQFCDAVLGTSLHSIKVHKAVLCSASAYLCGVLSQTCMGKSGGRILTVQFKADIPASSLSAFIDYIYQGRIKLVAKSVRDLNIMARCLHMESLKKTSDEMLASMGATNDADIAIPELILLETLVDKLDKECTASLPLPAPSPPPSCSVGVATDPPALSPPTQVEQSCQTEEAPFKDCGCSGARDWRSGGNALRLGGVGSLSLAVNGGCVAGGEGGDSEKPPLSTESKHHAVSDTSGGVVPFSTAVKPHHKKHLASQASRVKSESVVAVSVVPSLPASSLLLSSSSSASSSLSVAVTSLTSTTTTTIATTADPMQKLSIDTEGRGQDSGEAQSQIMVSGSATPATPGSSKVPGKARKRAAAQTTTPSPSPALPSTSTSSSSQPVLPGQTARPVLHSYGTRAATRTPTKNLDLGSNLPPLKQSVCQKGSGTVSEAPGVKDSVGDGSAEAQIQMAKHRGRTKKGRIAAALSEALKQSSQTDEAANIPDRKQLGNAGEDQKNTPPGAQLQSDLTCLPSSLASDTSPTSAGQFTMAASTSTTLTEAKRSAPRAYRKRLIQSVVTDQLLMAKTETPEEDGRSRDAEGQGSGGGEAKHQRLEDTGVPESKGVEREGAGVGAEQLRETLHSPVTTKRKKKGKTRRMLLSTPSSSGGVRVRAPPKKRAKMELEQMMREEMEEEEEEEEMAAAASAALKQERMEGAEAGRADQHCGQQPASGSVVRIKMPSTKPGKKPRWIKKDQVTHLLIELNQRASSVAEGGCVFVCLLCNNRFLLPKRCLSHVMATHKVPESEVMEQIEVRRQDGEGERCAAEEGGGSVPGDLVCDICGYRSRENTTYYLHYHKYFKHGVPLPKGWSVYTCDLCGKELFTKFQLKDHKRTHLEKTPFVCEICGSGFQSRSNLHSHVFHRHRVEKKHSCDKCDRTFKTRTQLSVHGRTHTGVRPFSCPECPYRSTTRGNMRLHLINRHKLSTSEASDIMRDMKPDFDVSLRSVSQQASSDSGGEKKPPSKRKSGGSAKARVKKEKEEKVEPELQQVPVPASTTHSGQGALAESTAMELLLKNSLGDALSSDKASEMAAGKETMGGEQQELSVLGPSVMLEGESSVVTLQAADPFRSAGGVGVGVCGGEAGAMFLPPGLETMFQQSGAAADLAMTSTVSSATAAATTTILVPENFLLQQPQGLQPSHKPLYPQAPPHFTSFVVGTAPTLQTLTPSDLIVSATALNPEGLKGDEVVDLGDMSMGSMEVDSALRQGAADLNPVDLNLQPPDASSAAAPHQTVVSSAPVATSQESGVQHLYMQHSPISPAPPISPTPVYVAVTPTPQPLAIVKQEGQDVAVPTVTVSAGAGGGGGGGGVLVDQLQPGSALQQYDASLLQAYYASQLYPHNC